MVFSNGATRNGDDLSNTLLCCWEYLGSRTRHVADQSGKQSVCFEPEVEVEHSIYTQRDTQTFE